MANSKAVTALRELLAGNQRFANGKAIHPAQTTQRRAEILGEQKPWAIIVGCSDSRVPPEIVFDRGLGDLFVVRTAGHVIDRVNVGTIQYAVELLGVPLIIVLGHSTCGAVTAAVQGLPAPGALADVVVVLRQSALISQAEPGDPITNAIKENIRRTVRQLLTIVPTFTVAPGADRLEIVGAYYDLATGLVDIVEAAPGSSILASDR
jgi:carbonic anhydrase